MLGICSHSFRLPIAAVGLPALALLWSTSAVHATESGSAGQSVAAVPSCSRDGGSIENSTEQRNNNVFRYRARWAGNRCSIDIDASGKIRFNSEFTNIVGVDNDGTVDITEEDRGTTRHLRLRPDASGGLVRTWSVNGTTRAWDDEGRRWLADLLIELDRSSALGVDYRYPHLIANGGPRAVLDEVGHMHSDYAMSVYLRRLIESERLSDGDYQRIATIAGHDMHSDYETSRVLREVADHASLDNQATRAAYLAAVDHMTSDYERSQVLRTIFAKSSITNAVAVAAVRAATSFSSDYERSRVLLAAIESKALAGDNVIPVIDAVSRSSSDYEKSRVLLAVAGRWTLSGESRKAYLRAADTIHSDYENRRVLAALVKQEAR